MGQTSAASSINISDTAVQQTRKSQQTAAREQNFHMRMTKDFLARNALAALGRSVPGNLRSLGDGSEGSLPVYH